MVYDSQRQRIVLFGGYGNGYQADTWEYDGTTWRQVNVSGPPGRFAHGMAYDAARQRVVLMGGWSGTAFLGDTWEYDGNGWNPIAATISPRDRHTLAYDSGRQRVVLFGGTNNTPNHTWQLESGSWRQLEISGPPARADHAMVYDVSRQRIVLFGGEGFSDTWELGSF